MLPRQVNPPEYPVHMPRRISEELIIHQRRLPHWQAGGNTYFVTWRLLVPGCLAPAEKDIVLECVKHYHKQRYFVSAAVIMPDHAHLLIAPMRREDGSWWDLMKLVGGMKGVSARRINRLRGCRGALWQDESFDRIVRENEFEFPEKYGYICENPVRAGLCKTREEYPWLWLVSLRDGYVPNQSR